MIPFRSAAIAGLGLIGGSLARDLAAAGIEVTGADSDPGALEAAMREGVLARGAGADLSEFGDAEVIVLALPADAAGRALNLLTTKPLRARLITDTGGTKRAILAAAEAGPLGERFVGSHPFAGDHRSGWGASRPGLFRDAKVYLSPSSRATADAVSLAHELWRLSGGLPEIIDPASHDRRMAFASHLPQIVSSAFGAVLAEAGFARSELGSGGRDVARLAGSSPDLWTPLCLENAEMLRAPLSALRSEIERLDAALAAGDEERVRSLFVRARDWSDLTAR
ncbi:MAG: prephenate dehydrogenase/arogenate dehydrogenase family protein [Acidobacteria bacterium]|nr:prephenate dehydrogenase/arogenate dehydrogenase family protein [Acidobacteriota bacterium]